MDAAGRRPEAVLLQSSVLASASRFQAGVRALFPLMADSKLQAQQRFPPKVLLGSFSTTAEKQIREELSHRVMILGEAYLRRVLSLPLAAHGCVNKWTDILRRSPPSLSQ